MIAVEWSPGVLRALFDAYEFIASDGPDAAARFVERIRGMAQLLGTQPQLGRPARTRNRREFVIDQYVLTYRVPRDRVWIVSLEHGAIRR